MAERMNRRELIIQTAAELFINQGYAATSVRQIARAVGCTEAALYYHFKEGKQALLQAVIESQAPDFRSILEACRQANSLSQLILTYTRAMCLHCEQRERRIQWFISEYPNLSACEKSIFDKKHVAFHTELVELFRPFMNDEQEANELGWLLICASFGYRQLFLTLGLDSLVDFSVDNFSKRIAYYLDR